MFYEICEYLFPLAKIPRPGKGRHATVAKRGRRLRIQGEHCVSAGDSYNRRRQQPAQEPVGPRWDQHGLGFFSQRRAEPSGRRLPSPPSCRGRNSISSSSQRGNIPEALSSQIGRKGENAVGEGVFSLHDISIAGGPG